MSRAKELEYSVPLAIAYRVFAHIIPLLLIALGAGLLADQMDRGGAMLSPLNERGVETKARVISKERKTEGGTAGAVFTLHVRFRQADGKETGARVTYFGRGDDKAISGPSVRIRYLPRSPAWAILASKYQPAISEPQILAGWALLIVGLILPIAMPLARVLRLNRMVKRSIREAMAAEAVDDELSAGPPQFADAAGASVREFLKALPERIDLPAPSRAYRIWMIVATAVAILLPVVYFGAIGWLLTLAWGYAADWFLSANLGWSFPKIAGTVSLMAGTGVVLLYLAKPFLAPSPMRLACSNLDRHEAPGLFELVGVLSRMAGVPEPRRIQVNLDVNASAGLGRGHSLIIGLALAKVLDMRQMVGTLAHELGHLAQSSGMRVSGALQLIRHLLARGCFQKDLWDVVLRLDCQPPNPLLDVPASLERLTIWITRCFYRLLLAASLLASSVFDRQSEYAADRYFVRAAGTEEFTSLLKKLGMLDLAVGKTFYDLDESWEQHQLCDDLPGLVEVNMQRIPAEVISDLDEHLDKAQTHFYDSHPAFNDRIRNVDGERHFDSGIPDMPATALWADFEGLSRRLTYAYYRASLGQEVSRESLISLDKVRDNLTEMEVSVEAARRAFQDSLEILNPMLSLADDSLSPLADPSSAVEALDECRRRIVQSAEDLREAMERRDRARLHLDEARQAVGMSEAGMWLWARSFDSKINKPSKAWDVHRKSSEIMRETEQTLSPVWNAARRRLKLGIQALHTDELTDAVADRPTLRQEAGRILPALAAMSKASPEIERLHAEIIVIGFLARELKYHRDSARFITALKRHMQFAHNHIASLRNLLGGTAFPFEHGRQDPSIADYAIEKVPDDPDDLGGLLPAASEAVSRLIKLYSRMMARMAWITETVEASLAIEPMPTPQPASQPGETKQALAHH